MNLEISDIGDIAAELRVRAAIEQIPGTLFDRAADEIEQLRAIVHNLDNATDRHPQRKQEDTTNDEHR